MIEALTYYAAMAGYCAGVYLILAGNTALAFYVIAIRSFEAGRHEVSALLLTMLYGIVSTVYIVKWIAG